LIDPDLTDHLPTKTTTNNNTTTQQRRVTQIAENAKMENSKIRITLKTLKNHKRGSVEITD